jgi:hypothetical protein
MSSAGKDVSFFDEGEAIGSGVVNLLDHGGNADFEELVEVAGRDGEKLEALEKRVAAVLGLFEHAAVELQPGRVAVEVILRIIERRACHGYLSCAESSLRDSIEHDALDQVRAPLEETEKRLRKITRKRHIVQVLLILGNCALMFCFKSKIRNCKIRSL